MVELYQVLDSKENITESNPYNISSPVTGSQFFGREKLLASILEMLTTAGQHMLIFGPARSGKTSFLQELMARLPAEEYVPVYWGVKDQGDLSSPAVWAALARSVAGQLRLRLPASKLPEDLDHFQTDFLPWIHKKIAPRRLVLLLDDVDTLLTGNSNGTPGFLVEVEQFRAAEYPVAFALSTSRKPQDLPLSLESNQQIRTEELPFLAPLETFFLVSNLSKPTPISYLFETIGKIWKLTAGHPYYVQLICHETFNYALKKDRQKIDVATLNEALPFILEKSSPDLGQGTADLSASALNTLAACALLFGQQPITPASVSRILNQNHLTIEHEELVHLFDELQERSILQLDEQGDFTFTMPLTAFWLLQQYPLQFIPAEIPAVPAEKPAPVAPPRPLPPPLLALVGSGALILLVALVGFALLMTNNTLATTSATSTTVGLAASPESFTAEPAARPVSTEEAVPTIPPTPTLVPATAEVSALLPTTTPTPALTPTATVAPTLAPSPTVTPLPTFTAAPTATPLPTLPPTATPLPTLTPLPTATSAPTLPPATATPLPPVPSPTAPAPPAPATTLPAGSFTLLNPLALDQPSYGLTEFEWQWTGPVPEGTGFEVRVWREGEPQMGVHDAVYDDEQGNIESLGENKYRLRVDITGAAGVQGVRGEYWWTVALVQTGPTYADLGQQAPPARMRFEPKNSGGGGGDGSSSGSVGVN